MRLNPKLSTRSDSNPDIALMYTGNRGTVDLRRLVQSTTRWLAGHPRSFFFILMMFLALPIWVSIGDHGFNGRSDARYAVVAMDMSQNGEWIVPHYMGQTHLTKPPLVYWFEAASIRVFGHSMFAARFPSALCGSVAILVLFGFAYKVTRLRIACIGTMLYATMPLTIISARMTVTDSIVNLLWLLILFSGYLKTQYPQQARWSWILWSSVALGMLAKGPVLFIPIGVVGVWWIICGFTPLKLSPLLKIAGLLALSMIPTLIWAFAVIIKQPNAIDIWMHETFDRVVGAGDHSRPFWFFVPILFAGCFPASAMLMIPGINLRWKDAIVNLRSGSLVGFLGWSCIVPFVLFSLNSGKLPSYILPICAPLALLIAIMLEQWFDETKPVAGDHRRIPEVRYGLFIGATLYVLAIASVVWHTYGVRPLISMYGLVLAAIIAFILVLKWKDRSFRVVGLSAFLIAWIVGWAALEEVEDVALAQMSSHSVLETAFGDAGWQGRAGVYRLVDGNIYWDRTGKLESFDTAEQLIMDLTKQDATPILIISTAVQWDAVEAGYPQLKSVSEVKTHWQQWPGAPLRSVVVCQPISSSEN